MPRLESQRQVTPNPVGCGESSRMVSRDDNGWYRLVELRQRLCRLRENAMGTRGMVVAPECAVGWRAAGLKV